MGNNRKLTAHQKQIRFLAIFFGVLMLIVVVALLLLLNRPVGGYH